jgi:hypothetical protein
MEIIKLPDGEGEVYAALFSPLKPCGLQAWIGFYVKNGVAELAVGTSCRDCHKCEKITYDKTKDFHEWLKQYKDAVFCQDPRLDKVEAAEQFEILASQWVETLPYPILLDGPSKEQYDLIKLQLVRVTNGTTHVKMETPESIDKHKWNKKKSRSSEQREINPNK